MQNAAFVTYNTVGDSLRSGWHDGPEGRRALVIQNSTGRLWGASIDPVLPAKNTGENANRVSSEIDNLWGQLREALSELDQIVVYVGDKGSEVAIRLAAELPAEKVTFALCQCNFRYKTALIRSHVAGAGTVVCECGGHYAMERLFQSFMATGSL